MQPPLPTLQTVNPDGTAVVITTKSVTITPSEVTQYIANLQGQIAQIQTQLNFYLTVQTQQNAAANQITP